MTITGVTVVIPAHNGRRYLPGVIAAIESQCADRPHEILVVDDGSSDGSRRQLDELHRRGRIRVIDGPGRGVAAAMNAGIREAAFPFICQIDQDVVIHPGWIDSLLDAFRDADVAAAQGRYTTPPGSGMWARAMGRDLEARYDALDTGPVDHVCTGNTVYRAAALHTVGLFDERFGYGADNDLSYRLVNAGYKLAFCPAATSVHHWRDTCGGYARQQFGVGYGRLDLVARHPNRVTGDDVSGVDMILHAFAMTVAVVLLVAAAISAAAGLATRALVAGAVAILLALALERAVAGVRAWRKSRDSVCLLFPAAHLFRDLAWVLAILVWAARRVAGSTRLPAHSMARSTESYRWMNSAEGWSRGRSTLVVVPAYNERQNLPRVVRDIKRIAPEVDLLVVDDGSSDGTTDLLPSLEVEWLSMPERVGVGNAVRAGIRYAQRQGYQAVLRVDGDGQHRACDLGRVLEPVVSGRADAVCGSRYMRRRAFAGRPIAKGMLAVSLSAMLRRRITDPTSGLWAFGPKAVRLLGRHHPTGYPEPELLLLLHRNGLRVEEAPIRVRPRNKGTTTLTWRRKGVAVGRTLLAFMVVPLRPAEVETGSDQ